MTRYLSALLPEAVVALAVAMIGLLTALGGATRGRWSRRALMAGLGFAAAAAGAGWLAGIGDDFLFAAYRIDGATQAAKAAVALLAVGALLIGRRDDGRWADARSDGSLFAALTMLGLFSAISAADLIGLVLAVALFELGFVGTVASGGRRAGTESPARRVLVGQMVALTLMLAGATLLAALAGATRFDDVAVALREVPPSHAWRAGITLLCCGFGAALGVPPLHGGWRMVASLATSGIVALAAGPVWVTAAVVLIRTATDLGMRDAGFGRLALLIAAGVAAGLAVAATRAKTPQLRLAYLGSALGGVAVMGAVLGAAFHG